MHVHRPLPMLIPVLLAAVVSAPPAGASPASSRLAPARIASDCSKDVARPLARWLQSLPNGETARLRKNGCYRVETEMVVRGKTRVTLLGQGATLRRTTYTPPARRYPNANAILRLVRFVDSSVRGLKIRGTNTRSDLSYLPGKVGSYRQEVEFDHGLALHGLVRTTVERIDIRSVWGDGVYLSGTDQWTAKASRDVVLRRIKVVRNGRKGITINRSHHVLIDRVNIHLSRRAAINLEPDTAEETISNVEIRDSRLGSNLVAISSAGNGRVNDIDVHDNLVWRTGVPWVYVKSSLGLERRRWAVRDNVVTHRLGSPMPALAFWNTHDITVSGNRMSLTTSQSQLAVGLWDGSSDADITCNVLLGAKRQFVDNPSGNPVAMSRNSLVPEATGCPTTASVDRKARRVPVPMVVIGQSTPLVQFARQRLGLPPGGDVFDPSVKLAVSDLQAAKGWPATGILDDRTWQILLNKPAP